MTEPKTHDVLSYTVLLDPDPDGGYVVTVPAIPGTVTQGDTLDEALTMARDVIELMLDDYREQGLPLPDDVATEVHRVTLAA